MITIAFLILGYLVFLVGVLAILTAAKRADEGLDRAASEALARAQADAPSPARDGMPAAPVETLPAHVSLAHVAIELRDVLAVERVAVILADPEEPDTGLVAACLGAPGLLGSRVPVEATATTGVLGPAEAAALGLAGETDGDASWTFAHVPLACPGGRMGAVTVAARRLLAFTSGEMSLIERLARHGAPHFERRRRGRMPRATA